MGFNKEQLKKVILEELKKMVVQKQSVSDNQLQEQIVKEDILNVNTATKEDFEDVNPKEIIIDTEEARKEAKEVKKIAEEFKRMKELVDFRSPLLGGKLF